MYITLHFLYSDITITYIYNEITNMSTRQLQYVECIKNGPIHIN